MLTPVHKLLLTPVRGTFVASHHGAYFTAVKYVMGSGGGGGGGGGGAGSSNMTRYPTAAATPTPTMRLTGFNTSTHSDRQNASSAAMSEDHKHASTSSGDKSSSKNNNKYKLGPEPQIRKRALNTANTNASVTSTTHGSTRVHPPFDVQGRGDLLSPKIQRRLALISASSATGLSALTCISMTAVTTVGSSVIVLFGSALWISSFFVFRRLLFRQKQRRLESVLDYQFGFNVALSALGYIQNMLKVFFQNAKPLSELKHPVLNTLGLVSLYHKAEIARLAREAYNSSYFDEEKDEPNSNPNSRANGKVDQGKSRQQTAAFDKSSDTALFARSEDKDHIKIDIHKQLNAMKLNDRQVELVRLGQRYMEFSSAAYPLVLLKALKLLPLMSWPLDYVQQISVKVGIPEEDVVAVDEVGVGLFSPVHFVAVDHQTKSVVVSVRGTSNFKDVLADVVADSILFPLSNRVLTYWESQSNEAWDKNRSNERDQAEHDSTVEEATEEERAKAWGCFHNGILRSAVSLYHFKLDHFLEDLVNANPGYSLVLTGHSLGAGVAQSLCIYMLYKDQFFRDLAQQDRLKCFAFAPPHVFEAFPSLPAEMQALYDKIIVSFVNADDIVPRMSIGAAARLFELVEAIDEYDDLDLTQREAIVGASDFGDAFKHVSAALEKLEEEKGRDVHVDVPQEKKDYASLTIPGKDIFWMFSDDLMTADTPESTKRDFGRFMAFPYQSDKAGKPEHIIVRRVDPIIFKDLVFMDSCLRNHFPDMYESAFDKAVHDE